jgi:hypothetical protein
MRRGAEFHISTTVYILYLLIARFLWIPYIGPMTMEWQFHLVRWAYYAMAIGAGNLFYYMTLTNFRMEFIPSFLIPMGFRVGLDGLIWLSATFLGEFSIIIRYMLDALFIIAAGISITWVDRKKKKWEHRKGSLSGRIVLSLLLTFLSVMVIILQADVLKIAQKYVKDSEDYIRSISYISMRAYLISIAVSFVVQYAMVLFFIDKKQNARVRRLGILRPEVMGWLLFAATLIRYFISPAYFSVPDYPSRGEMLKYDNDVRMGFHAVDYIAVFCRLNQAHEEIDESIILPLQIYDKDYQRSIRFSPSEAWYTNELIVNGHKVFYYSPYALFYFDGQEQQLFLVRDIQKKPKDDMLIEILKQGILDGDFYCFEYGSEYLLKYAPDFIRPFIERYAKGAFTDQELKDMGDIRPEYVQELARRFEAAQNP